MANSIPGVGGASSAQQIEPAETSQASKQSLQSGSRNASDTAPSQQVSDATNLSKLGNIIASAAKAAGSQSSIRSGLVASLKAQIAAGTYHPDPDEVAARVAAALGT